MKTSKVAAKTSAASSWTDDQVEALKAGYTGSDCNATLANLVAGKTVPAIRSKLVSLGIYEKADPATAKAAAGTAAMRKIEIVTAIEILASLNKGQLESLEKASKPDLEKLAEALTKLSARHDADNGLTSPQQDAQDTQDA